MSKHDAHLTLIETGAQAFIEKGYHAVGLQEILTRAHVPKGSFYHYFRSKEDFCIAIIEHYIRLYVENHLRILFDRSLPAKARLLAFFAQEKEYYLEKQCQQSCLLAKLAMEMSRLSEPIRAALQRGVDGWVKSVAACLSEGIAAGDFTLDRPPETTAEFFYATWTGATTRMQVTQSVKPLEIAIEFFAREISGPARY